VAHQALRARVAWQRGVSAAHGKYHQLFAAVACYQAARHQMSTGVKHQYQHLA